MRPFDDLHALNSCVRSRLAPSRRRTVNDGGTVMAGGVWKSPCARTLPLPVPARTRAAVTWRPWFSGNVLDVVLVVDVVIGTIVLVVVVGPGAGQVASMPFVTSAASA